MNSGRLKTICYYSFWIFVNMEIVIYLWGENNVNLCAQRRKETKRHLLRQKKQEETQKDSRRSFGYL